MEKQIRTSNQISKDISRIVKDVTDNFKPPKVPNVMLRISPKSLLEDVALKEIKNEVLESLKNEPKNLREEYIDNPLKYLSEKKLEEKLDKKLEDLWNNLTKVEKSLYEKKARDIVMDNNLNRMNIISSFKNKRLDYIEKLCKKYRIKPTTIINIIGNIDTNTDKDD